MNNVLLSSNLWPTLKEIGSADFTAPVIIMRQQADSLSAMTKNILEGQVTSEKVNKKVTVAARDTNSVSMAGLLVGAHKETKYETRYVVDDEKVRYVFSLRASVLDGATVRLFTVTHDIAPAYPVVVSSRFLDDSENDSLANDEEQFQATLYNFFHSKKVIEILQSLIGQSIGPGVDLSDSD